MSIMQIILSAKLASLLTFVFETITAIVVCAIVEIIFAFSHKKSKKIINNCLIKIIPKTISPSVKN
jgi:transcription termination factor NusB